MHISLYRKYRSKNFDEIIGQAPIITTLKNAIKSGKISHAYLFSGPRGTGKTSTARVFAKALNCSNRNGVNPCDKCEQCKKITLGTAVNVIEIDAASNRKIEDIRDLKDKIAYKTLEGIYKVYIIDEVHMLTNEAFNAILKTLEEPPANTVFILATTEPQKVPITIASRCQRFDFGRISSREIINHLKKIAKEEKIKIGEAALESISRACEGSLRDAISLLDQLSSFCTDEIKIENVIEVLGTSEPQFIFDLAQSLIQGDEKKAVSLTDKAILEGVPSPQIIKDLLWHFRNMLVVKIGSEEILEIPKEQIDLIKSQSKQLQSNEIKEIVKKLSSIDSEMRYHSSPRLLLDITIVDLCSRNAKSQKISEIKLNATENNFNNKIESKEETKENPTIENSTNPTTDVFTTIKANWKEILEKIKSKSPFGYVSLSEAEPYQIDKNGRLIISFKKGFSFHKSRIEEPQNKTLLEECIKSISGKEISVSCIISETQQTNPKTIQSQSISVSDLEEIFDGNVIA